MSNTSSTSFEFRISSMRFFHRSFSDSTPLLSFTFLSSFPLSPIHSSPPFTLSFLSAPPPLLPLLRSSRCSLSLSLDPHSPALDTGNAVPLSRAQRCGNVARAGVRRAQGRVVGTVGKFSCRRLCARRQWCSTIGTGNPARLPAFTLQERFTAHAKKGGVGRGKKVYH